MARPESGSSRDRPRHPPLRTAHAQFGPERLPEPPQAPISRCWTSCFCGSFCRAPEFLPMADQDLFFSRNGMDPRRVRQLVDEALKSSDDGELFLEYCQSESFAYDDN